MTANHRAKRSDGYAVLIADSSTPRSLPASLARSEWEGMSGAVVFAADAYDDEQAAVGSLAPTIGRRESRP